MLNTDSTKDVIKNNIFIEVIEDANQNNVRRNTLTLQTKIRHNKEKI